jgi:UDP-glucose 4-epimerase
MSVLVTGGAGYIGSHMVLELLDAGEEVARSTTVQQRGLTAPKGVAFVQGDAATRRSWDLIQREVDSIIHFAASVVVPESVADPALLPQQHRQVPGADRGRVKAASAISSSRRRLRSTA